jgi:hypothetical protein
MNRLQPALVGGLFIGVLSVLPHIRSCCCLWVVVGGALTVYVMQQGRETPVESSEAALQGLLAGVIGGVLLVLALAMVPGSILGTDFADRVREAVEANSEAPPEARQIVQNIVGGAGLSIILGIVTIPVYAVIGMLGALLGLPMFRKKTPPAPPQESGAAGL